MATAFDRGRGECSGRIVPRVAAPVLGERVFVLGAEGALEVERLTDGDYTQVSQAVDLTAVDLIGASAETIGVPMQEFVDPIGLTVAADTIGLWPLDYDCSGSDAPPVAFNARAAGPDLPGIGDLAQAAEIYHAAGHRGLCAEFPVGTTTAQFAGVNTPLLWAAPLGAYTLDVWVNFLAASHAASTGIDPTLFRCLGSGANGGLHFLLAGTLGGHAWTPTIEHRPAAGPTVSRAFGGYTITTNPGWQMLTVVYDGALVGPQQLKLYIDGVYICDAVAAIGTAPGANALSGAVELGSPALWGNLGAVRIANTAHTAGQVLADYESVTVAPVPRAAAWRQQILIDGIVYVERTIRADERRTWRDFLAPVRLLSGVHTVAFRLSLQEVL